MDQPVLPDIRDIFGWQVLFGLDQCLMEGSLFLRVHVTMPLLYCYAPSKRDTSLQLVAPDVAPVTLIWLSLVVLHQHAFWKAAS